MLRRGLLPSPLMSAPWVKASIFRRDWLHCSDQGVAADFGGNVSSLLAAKMPGANVQVRTQQLWDEIQRSYDAAGVDPKNQLNTLTPKMIQQQGKKPKLRANATEMRHLVPILHQLSQQFLDDANPIEAAAKTAALHLNECYKALADDAIFYHASLTEHSTAFALQMVALADVHQDTRLWQLKPKLHQWLELCAEGTKPAKCWTYRDEDFGGSCARMAHRRGGQISARAVSRNLLENFRMKQPMIVVR